MSEKRSDEKFLELSEESADTVLWYTGDRASVSRHIQVWVSGSQQAQQLSYCMLSHAGAVSSSNSLP